MSHIPRRLGIFNLIKRSEKKYAQRERNEKRFCLMNTFNWISNSNYNNIKRLKHQKYGEYHVTCNFSQNDTTLYLWCRFSFSIWQGTEARATPPSSNVLVFDEIPSLNCFIYLLTDSLFLSFLLFFVLCFASDHILESFMEIIWDSQPKTNGPKRGLLLEMARALIGIVLFNNHHEPTSSAKLFKSYKYWWYRWWRCRINNYIVVVFLPTINHFPTPFITTRYNTSSRNVIISENNGSIDFLRFWSWCQCR